jgi:hypothetical protein
MSLTEVWISREEMVDFLLYAASLEASVATRSKISENLSQDGCLDCCGQDDIPLTNEFKMDMARLEIPVSGWTCLRTAKDASALLQDDLASIEV